MVQGIVMCRKKGKFTKEICFRRMRSIRIRLILSNYWYFTYCLIIQKIIEEKNNLIIKQKNDLHILSQQFVDKNSGIYNTNNDNSLEDAMLNNNEASNFSLNK